MACCFFMGNLYLPTINPKSNRINYRRLNRMNIAAILTTHNSAATLERVLRHLANNAIRVYAIDHGSTDATPSILATHVGKPIAEIIQKPFDGIFRLRQQLQWKSDIIQRINADWIIHIDADEILESPREGESLRGMIERMNATHYDVIDCDEFVFVPENEQADYRSADFVTTMRHYYYFAPPGRALHRAFRRSSGAPEWAHTGGHRLGLANRKLAPEKIRMRHYIGLSMDALRAQYLSRVFAVDELRKGWHHNRVATTADFIIPPPPARLFNLDEDGWRTDMPETKHLIFNQPQPYIPPAPIASIANRPAMPFIVGVGRSGTTLLRLLMDAHPDLAITPETHWLSDAITAIGSIKQLRHVIIGNTYWKDIGISDKELDAILEKHNGEKPFDTLRAIYQHYGKRFGKSRVGDKTPIHGLIMHKIAHAFPEAHFIHIIRDGRDVAVSYRDMWFGPGKDAKTAAKFWLWRIREMRQQAQFLPHYMEVRYEQLVTEPETVLRTIGEFIQLPFHRNQLRAHEHADSRLAEFGNIQHGGAVISTERRKAIFAETLNPPNDSRIGRWRTEMTKKEMADFESIAGNMLAELGYL